MVSSTPIVPMLRAHRYTQVIRLSSEAAALMRFCSRDGMNTADRDVGEG